MTRRHPWLVVLLALAVLASAMGVVYAKFLSRKYFVQLQQLRAEHEEVDIQWGRLQLEESSLAAYFRVEAKARGELGMHIPRVGEATVLREP